MKLTLHVRVKDKHSKLLCRMAKDVNRVWNYANELSYRAWREKRTWLSGYTVSGYVAGVTKTGLMIIPAATIQEITTEHGRKRKQFKRSKLRWRSNKRSLGWIPFRNQQLQQQEDVILFYGHRFKVWDSYGLNNYKFRNGSFSQDARGRWYLNIVVEILEQPNKGIGQVGIDLGLKSMATYSNGKVFKPEAFYRNMEPKLATAQRARNKIRVRAIHAKIANRRKDSLHKETTRLIKKYKSIIVGDVNSTKLIKTRMAKSILDVSWYMFRNMLKYKAIKHSTNFIVINEAFTTRTCSSCGAQSGPQGVNGLRIREWTCSACSVTHDRDVNAAKNILAVGSGRLAEEIQMTPKETNMSRSRTQ